MKHLLEILNSKPERCDPNLPCYIHVKKRLSSSHNPSSELSSSLSFVNKSSWTFPQFISRQRQPADCSTSACQAWSFKTSHRNKARLAQLEGGEIVAVVFRNEETVILKWNANPSCCGLCVPSYLKSVGKHS